MEPAAGSRCGEFYFLVVAFRSWRLPQCPDRNSKKALTKSHGPFAVVQHKPRSETFACGFLQLSQTSEIAGGHRGGRLDFNPCQFLGAPFKNDIDLDPVFVAKMVE
jgi:hypothetical protein